MSYPSSKTILVLANSMKKGGRCVAGLEATLVATNTYRLGNWIRPIDADQDEGTIPNERTRISNRMLKPLDLVEIQFLRSANDPHHPEDVVIDGAVRWKHVGIMGPQVLLGLNDQSGDLWGPARRVVPREGTNTLRLIKPQGACHVMACREEVPWGRGVRDTRILTVVHHGIHHQFSIDDPEFTQRHDLSPASVGDRQVRFDLDPAKTIIVASLTKPFKGFQYKIAACIFEL